MPASVKDSSRKFKTQPSDFRCCVRSALPSLLPFFSHVTLSRGSPCAWHLSLMGEPWAYSEDRLEGFLNFGGRPSVNRGMVTVILLNVIRVKKSSLPYLAKEARILMIIFSRNNFHVSVWDVVHSWKQMIVNVELKSFVLQTDAKHTRPDLPWIEANLKMCALALTRVQSKH